MLMLLIAHIIFYVCELECLAFNYSIAVLHYFMLASAVGLLQTVNSNLHSCNLLSLLVKNNLKSAGFLVAGPLTLCLSEQPRRNLSCDLLKNYDMNL